MSARALLITGATGGLGLALVKAAREAGHDVVATGRSTAPADRITAMGAKFVAADLTESGVASRLCAGRESVIHAAALSSSWGRKADFWAINVDATHALLDAAARAGCRRFVFVSSPSIYAAMRDRIGLAEDDAPASPPLNHYAISKLEAEQLVAAANSATLSTAIVRPRAIVGPDDNVLLPRLVALARRKAMPLPGGGCALIELTDVRDVARAILLAEARAPALAGAAINISGGRPVAVKEIATRLAAALGLQPRLVAVPMAMARPLASGLEALAKIWPGAREPVLTRYTLATLGFSQTFDLSAARRLLGIEPEFDALATLLDEAEKRFR